jgi:uncharacterized lipoprotein NlpE involved in copper resistance
MKKLIILSLAVTTLLLGCDIRKQLEKKENANKPKEAPESIAARKLIGAYTGTFGTGKINLLITSAVKDTISGRSVFSSADNLITGIVKLDKGSITISLKDFGKVVSPGKYKISVNEKHPDTLIGTWIPDSVTKTATTVSFTLVHKKPEYKKDAGIYSFSSIKEISDGDLNSLSHWETTLMKSEILARHGMIFTDNSLKDAFETKDWYVPVSDDVSTALTAIEKKNVETIDAHR